MKRWLGLLIAIGILGLLSIGDPSFGIAAHVQDAYGRCSAFVSKKYGDQIIGWCTFWGKSPQVSPEKKYEKRGLIGRRQSAKWGIGASHGTKKRWWGKWWRRRPIKKEPEVISSSPSEPIKEVIIAQPATQQESAEVSEPSASSEMQPCPCLSHHTKPLKESSLWEPPFVSEPVQPQSEYHAPPYHAPPIPPPTQHPYPAVPSVQPPMQYVQPIVQQPVYQNNMQQMAASAMQLQASAMAMQAQASALMMQAQQTPQPMAPPVMMPQPGPFPSMQGMSSNIAGLSKDQKMSQLMQHIQQLSQVSEQDIHRLLLLLDTEFDIIEHLLTGASGQIIEQLVYKRRANLQQSSPLMVRMYDLMIDLATTTGKEAGDPHLYHYFIRRGKRSKELNGGHGKKQFLLQMMYRLEQYYQMIENMQRVITLSS